MLNKLTLQNFKLFKDRTEFPLSKINLLTGVNGRGKSSVLQPFLLLMQSPGHDRNTDNIQFNGNCVNLGYFVDVKNIENTVKEPLIFLFNYSAELLTYDIEYTIVHSPDENLIGQIVLIKISGEFDKDKFSYEIVDRGSEFELFDTIANTSTKFSALFDLFIPSQYQTDITKAIYSTLPFLKIHYISADRIGPKLFYTSQSQKKFDSTGSLGENTISTLFHCRNNQVETTFIDYIGVFYNVIPAELETTVEGQINFWLDKIFNGAKYEIKEVVDTNLLTFFVSPDGSFNYHKPTNVGYGFSYILPILVSGLISKPGEIMIIENPEAHLHPYAQSIIAKFLTLVALKGVQVIIESHSEHILNGLRISVFEDVISSQDLSVLYFDRDTKEPFIKIEMNDDGGIRNWPKDFFDQSTKDLNYLLGL